MAPYRELLNRRLQPRPTGWLDIATRLVHFSLINYAVPRQRLEPHIAADRFEIPEYHINGRPMALLSVVPYIDEDFHYIHLFPFLKFRFGQTNHRVYVIDQRTGEPCVWFLGTTLGSPLVHFARLTWGIPWHYGRYTFDCRYEAGAGRYTRYRCRIDSDWCAGEIEIDDTGEPITTVEGFGSYDEMKLSLTHPVDGYFYRPDGRVGTYSISHPEMTLTAGRPRHLYFSLYERLGIMSKDEMQKPHSIFVCPEIQYIAYMPPRVVL